MSEEFLKARKKALTGVILKYGVCIFAGAIIAVGMAGSGNEEDKIFAIFGFFLFFGITRSLFAAFSKNRAYGEFVSLYKRDMINNALNGADLYEEMEFDYKSGLNPQAVSGSGMFTTNRYFSDCYLTGKYNGVPFVQAYVRNVAGRRNEGFIKEYSGMFYIFPVKLPDSTNTSVYDKDHEFNLVIHGKEVKTKDAAFDAAFKVNTDNVEKMQALLTGEVRQKLLSIKGKMAGRICFTVNKGQMYLFISDKKSVLKPNPFRKYEDSMKTAVIEELNRVKLFIDAFSI